MRGLRGGIFTVSVYLDGQQAAGIRVRRPISEEFTQLGRQKRLADNGIRPRCFIKWPNSDIHSRGVAIEVGTKGVGRALNDGPFELDVREVSLECWFDCSLVVAGVHLGLRYDPVTGQVKELRVALEGPANLALSCRSPHAACWSAVLREPELLLLIGQALQFAQNEPFSS